VVLFSSLLSLTDLTKKRRGEKERGGERGGERKREKDR